MRQRLHSAVEYGIAEAAQVGGIVLPPKHDGAFTFLTGVRMGRDRRGEKAGGSRRREENASLHRVLLVPVRR